MTKVSEQFDPKRIRRSRITFLLIVGLFVLPFLLALIVTSDLDRFYPGEAVYGELIKPAIVLQEFSLEAEVSPMTIEDFKGHWTLLYVANSHCDAACRQHVHMLQNIHAALGAARTRVKKLVVLDSIADGQVMEGSITK